MTCCRRSPASAFAVSRMPRLRRKPAAPSRRAMAAPIPRLEPEIITTRPSADIIGVSPGWTAVELATASWAVGIPYRVT